MIVVEKHEILFLIVHDLTVVCLQKLFEVETRVIIKVVQKDERWNINEEINHRILFV